MRSRYPDIDKAKMIDAFCGDNSMIEFENIQIATALKANLLKKSYHALLEWINVPND